MYELRYAKVSLELKELELYTDSVFRYEPFGIFPVFFIPKPKGNSVGKFGII